MVDQLSFITNQNKPACLKHNVKVLAFISTVTATAVIYTRKMLIKLTAG
jgi:hypothetical protein